MALTRPRALYTEDRMVEKRSDRKRSKKRTPKVPEISAVSPSKPKPPTLDEAKKAGYSAAEAEHIVAAEVVASARGEEPYGDKPSTRPSLPEIEDAPIATSIKKATAVKDKLTIVVTLRKEERCRYGATTFVLTPGKRLRVHKEIAQWLISTGRCK